MATKTTKTTKTTTPTTTEPLKKIGDKITWTSQAGGFAVEKSGTIVAIVRGIAMGHAGDDLFDLAEKHGLTGQKVLPSHVKGQAHAFADRYLVRVLRHGAKGQKTALFYAPAVKVIDNALRKAKAEKTKTKKGAPKPVKNPAEQGARS